jgi:hypothetical protein
MLMRTQRDNSMLTFESSSVQGATGIVEKLAVRRFEFRNCYIVIDDGYRDFLLKKFSIRSRPSMRNLAEMLKAF